MDALTLFRRAAIETLQTRKARIAFQGAVVGAAMGAYASTRGVNPLAAGLAFGVGAILGQTITETARIYRRIRSEQFNNG